MTDDSSPVRLGGVTLSESGHVCAFFRSTAEADAVLLPFVAEGFTSRDKAFHIVDPASRADHLTKLAGAGVEVDGALGDGQLEVRGWDEAYLRDGHFSQDAMLTLLEGELQRGRRQGFRLVRLVAQMEWALADRPGVDDLVEYETRLNYVLPRYRDPVVCTYDLSKFGGQVVMDILRTHPLVIVGGRLQENRFYVGPDEFLREIRRRRPSAS